MPENHRSIYKQKVVMFLAVAIILAGGVHLYLQWSLHTRGIPDATTTDSGFGGPDGRGGGGWGGGTPDGARGEGGERRRPSESERQEQFQQISATLNLTPEQQQQLQSVHSQGRPQNREEMEQRMNQVQQILRPEQLEQMRSMMGNRMQQRIQRRLEEAQRTLPADQYEVFEEKLQQRIEQRRAAWQQRRRDNLTNQQTGGAGR